jgi:putative SOS response-associated peptidase YedK
MCGRYPSTRQAPLVGVLEAAMVADAELVGVLATAPARPVGLESWWSPRWNVAPTQPVRAIAMVDDAPRLLLARWGLTPPPGGAARGPIFNARAESAATSPLFRGPLARRRCLVFADGFYEWRGAGKQRTPVRFAPREGVGAADGRAITLAGLLRRWPRDGHQVDEVTILTTAADRLTAPIHDRRPVLIAPDDRARWLDPDLGSDAITELLWPPPFTDWAMTDAPPWLNNARNEHDPTFGW